MESKSGREKLLHEYSEVLFVAGDENGERIVKPEAALTDLEKSFFSMRDVYFSGEGDNSCE